MTHTVTSLTRVSLTQIQDLIAFFEREMQIFYPAGDLSAPYVPLDRVDLDALLKEEPLGITLESAEGYLDFSPGASDAYDTWIKTGMALKLEFGEAGFDLFNRWSRTSTKYHPGTVRGKYDSFGLTKGLKYTFRSIIAEHNSKNRKDLNDFRDSGLELIQACENVHVLMRDIAPLVGELSATDEVLRCEFENALKLRVKQISGTRVFDTKTVRKQLALGAAKKLQREVLTEEKWSTNCEDWAKNYIYVLETDQFIDIRDFSKISPRAIRRAHLNDMRSVNDDLNDAADYLLTKRAIPRVMSYVYQPGEPIFVTKNELTYYNTFTLRGAAARRKASCEEEFEAIRVFKAHICNLVGAAHFNREATIIVNFLRVCVETPGTKINWALYIQGMQGCGKSLLCTLMLELLGGVPNVFAIIGAQVASASETGFTGWATGHCLTFIEEVSRRGHNRYDIATLLKPYLTNSYVPIQRKGMEAEMLPNTTNYAITTNDKTAIPMTDDERRYFVILSPIDTKKLRTEQPDYYDKLVNAIQNHAGVLGDWITSIKFHDDFTLATAPASPGLETVVKLCAMDSPVERALERMDEEGVPREVLTLANIRQAVASYDSKITEYFLRQELEKYYDIVADAKGLPLKLETPHGKDRVFVKKGALITSIEDIQQQLNPSMH